MTCFMYILLPAVWSLIIQDLTVPLFSIGLLDLIGNFLHSISGIFHNFGRLLGWVADPDFARFPRYLGSMFVEETSQ